MKQKTKALVLELCIFACKQSHFLFVPLVLMFAPCIGHAGATMLNATNDNRLRPTAAFTPELNPNAFWVDSTICTVVIKTPIEINKPIRSGTPIDQIANMPAICTSNSGQSVSENGVRTLLNSGFRVKGVSHSVTALGALADGKVELLLSAVFALERPEGMIPGLTR